MNEQQFNSLRKQLSATGYDLERINNTLKEINENLKILISMG